jgi:hypothetical protein
MQTLNQVTLTAAVLLAAACTPSFAQIVAPGGWDVDFNADTPGMEPDTVPYADSVINTTPNDLDTQLGNTVVVQSALGALTDQPVVISSTIPISSLPSVQFGFDPTPPLNQTVEFDLLVDSTTAPAGGTKIFSIRLLASAGVLVQSMAIRNQDAGGGELDLLPDFAGDWTIWDSAFNDFFMGTPINLRIEIDRIAETASWYMNDNLFLLSTDPGLANAGTIQFRDAGGLGGSAQPFVVGLDNFITPAPPPSITQFSVADTPALQYLSESGLTYSLECSTGGDFDPAGVEQTGNGLIQRFYDPSGFDTGKTYRVVATP